MKTLLSGFVGALIGATISGFIAFHIFEKQVLIDQYALFTEDIEKAYAYALMWKSSGTDEKRKQELKTEAELSFNRAWARAFVILPDNIFLEIDQMMTRDTIDAKTRNRIYYLLRQQLYQETSLKYDDFMERKISLKGN